jgi:hypothetical protein
MNFTRRSLTQLSFQVNYATERLTAEGPKLRIVDSSR